VSVATVQKNLLGANFQTKFVTLNFDTFIEDKLPKLIYDTYSAHGAYDFPHVIHVHGKLQTFDGDIPVRSQYRDRGSVRWLKWVADSLDQINVTSDDIPSSVLTQAQMAIDGAAVLCFLGFSYNEVNLIKRLGVPNTLRLNKVIFGSAYRLSGSDVERVRMRFHPASIHLVNAKCREVFDDAKCLI
jgi:hypothetical protein